MGNIYLPMGGCADEAVLSITLPCFEKNPNGRNQHLPQGFDETTDYGGSRNRKTNKKQTNELEK